MLFMTLGDTRVCLIVYQVVYQMNWLWKAKCLNRFKYNCTHQNDRIGMKTLRNIGVSLHVYCWKDSTLSLLHSLLKRSHTFLGKCCRLLLREKEIKVKTSASYKICKYRYKLCHINKTGQSTTWTQICINI